MVWAVMELFASGDYALFQWFNRGVVNPVFDVLMPILSGNPLFKPGLAVLAIALFWKGGRRGLCCALMLAATLAVGETGTGILKRTVGRPRPYATHPETRMLAGKGLNGSMPSGHAAIWAGAAIGLALGWLESGGLRPLPLTAAGWWRSGDAGRLGPAGLELLGRLDGALSSGGETVFPEQLEARLQAEAHAQGLPLAAVLQRVLITGVVTLVVVALP